MKNEYLIGTHCIIEVHEDAVLFMDREGAAALVQTQHDLYKLMLLLQTIYDQNLLPEGKS